MGLKEKLHNFKEKHQDKKWLPVFSGFHTFLFTPNETTHGGTHIKAADDLKRTMNTVVMALVPLLIFGMFNAGFQQSIAINHNFSSGMSFFSPEFWTMDNFLIGFWKILPLVIVSYGVGLGVEFIFAIISAFLPSSAFLISLFIRNINFSRIDEGETNNF